MLGLSGGTNDTITLTRLAFAVPRQVVGGDFLECQIWRVKEPMKQKPITEHGGMIGRHIQCSNLAHSGLEGSHSF